MLESPAKNNFGVVYKALISAISFQAHEAKYSPLAARYIVYRMLKEGSEKLDLPCTPSTDARVFLPKSCSYWNSLFHIDQPIS